MTHLKIGIRESEVEALRGGIDQVPQILRDALGVFIDARSKPSVQAYVAARYAGMPESFRQRKIAEVGRRIQVARAILRVDGVELVDAPPPPGDPLAAAVAPVIAAAIPACEHAGERLVNMLAEWVARRVREDWPSGNEPERLQEELALQVLGDDLPHCEHAALVDLDHHDVAEKVMEKVREVYPAMQVGNAQV